MAKFLSLLKRPAVVFVQHQSKAIHLWGVRNYSHSQDPFWILLKALVKNTNKYGLIKVNLEVISSLLLLIKMKTGVLNHRSHIENKLKEVTSLFPPSSEAKSDGQTKLINGPPTTSSKKPVESNAIQDKLVTQDQTITDARLLELQEAEDSQFQETQWVNNRIQTESAQQSQSDTSAQLTLREPGLDAPELDAPGIGVQQQHFDFGDFNPNLNSTFHGGSPPCSNQTPVAPPQNETVTGVNSDLPLLESLGSNTNEESTPTRTGVSSQEEQEEPSEPPSMGSIVSAEEPASAEEPDQIPSRPRRFNYPMTKDSYSVPGAQFDARMFALRKEDRLKQTRLLFF